MTMNETQREQARAVTRATVMVYNYLMARVLEKRALPAITLRQINLIAVVRERSGVSMKELARVLGVTASSASIMVDRLVELGALTREQNPVDRREVNVKVSGQFGSEIGAAEGRAFGLLEDLFSKLGPEHTRTWSVVSARVNEILEGERTHGARNTRP
jgi:DNA-binding MarR family transcriptional regulator